MKKPFGIFPPMFTIWNKDEVYDEKASERYIRWLIDNGAQSIVACGSTGENTAMKTDEQKQVISHVVSYIAGEVPVYAGTGKYATKETLELSLHAKEVGVDGLMIIMPYYFKPYKEAVMNHYRFIYKETGMPIILYNNPWFCGYEMTAQEIKTLADEGVLIGVKSAHGDANRISELRHYCSDDFIVFYGHDSAAFQGFISGANGWLSGFPAAFPKLCREIQDVILVEKNVEKGRKIWDKCVPFLNVFLNPEVNTKYHWIEMLKWCACEQGINVGRARKPLSELSSEGKKLLKKPLETMLG